MRFIILISRTIPEGILLELWFNQNQDRSERGFILGNVIEIINYHNTWSTELYSDIPVYGISIPRAIQKLSGYSSWQPALGGPAWAGGWTRWPPLVPSNLNHSVCETHQQVWKMWTTIKFETGCYSFVTGPLVFLPYCKPPLHVSRTRIPQFGYSPLFTCLCSLQLF